MADVTLTKLVKNYDNTPVIHGIDAQFPAGEFVVIVGPSGCGKSTVLRMVAGLEEISEGQVLIGSQVMNDVEPKDRKIAMVFQNYALYPHMTVFNNMAYGLKIRKHSKEEIARRVNEAAEMLQLEKLLDRKPRQLSGGQRQRVAMGRALVRKPEVFLFDEPLSNLDAKLRHQMRVELKRLHKQLGTTMIYVTHDQVEAMTLADRIMILNAGRIEQIGTPDQIYHEPVSTFVGGFIGSPPMNFLSAAVDNTQLNFADYSITLQNRTPSTPEVTVGIRPEKIAITPTPHPHSIPVRIDFVEKLGSGKLLYTNLGDEPLVISIMNGMELENGEYHISLPEEDLHFFDKDSGQRLTT
ncbi:MAG: sn-glycerol-3-phosphate ABC transporter ATP-binding protein UgpC [Desulfobulbaceae bacterium]|nr:MAG: sn-glycerol-3-phosphate ABC transporter ATP-binding protein UgpC [Desulfobulbaceae bacterium]